MPIQDLGHTLSLCTCKQQLVQRAGSWKWGAQSRATTATCVPKCILPLLCPASLQPLHHSP